MARDTRRILDAGSNRAREALRVMEDAARFSLDDRDLTERLKRLRHDLREAMGALPGGELAAAAHRDAPEDVGTSVSTASERSRASLREVAIAAGKRLGESLRSLEEVAKTVDPAAGARLESLRYRAYDAERALALGMGAAPTGFTGWRCCVLLTESLCALAWEETAERAIEGGADCLQLREKDLGDRELLARARELVALARGRADVVINDRPDIALLAGARGAHLGREDMTITDARRIAGGDLLLGVSTANLQEARRALREGADICGVGPMFLSDTKPKDRLAGPAHLREYLSHEPPLPPALAISGVTPARIAVLREAAGGRPFGVAVSGFVCVSEDPARRMREILEALSAGSTARAPV